MKPFSFLIALVFFSVSLFAQTPYKRIYPVGSLVVIADSSGANPLPYATSQISIRPDNTSRVLVVANGRSDFYPLARFLNQSGTPYSTVSADAAITAFINAAATATGGSSGTATTTDASKLTTGTLPDARLSPNVAKTSDVVSVSNTVLGLNALNGLPMFLSKLSDAAPVSQVPIKIVGNSIAFGTNTLSYYLAQAIARQYGTSQSQYINPVSGPAQGWLQQYYSGTGSIRLRGNTGQGASGITKGVQASSFTIYYSTEPDGGQMGVSIQSGTGTAVVQTPISCSGVSSYGNSVTYTLDPNVQSLIVVSPPATGFAYWEGYYVDAGDVGVVVNNTAWGGSALGNHAGTLNRPAGNGMAATATPSGNKGILATFAPAKVPGLLIFGPILTNDTNDPAFASNVDAAITAAVNNGSSVLAIIEPINAQVNVATWNTMRAAMYAAQTKFPRSVVVYDWDRFMSPDGSFNQAFHNPDQNDPHPGTYSAGNPHVLATHDVLYRLNIPFPSNLARAIARDNLNFANLAPLANAKLTGIVGVNSSSSPGGVVLDVQGGKTRFGQGGISNGDIDVAGTIRLTENTGGLSLIDVSNSSPSGASLLRLSNTGSNGRSWEIGMYGNNAQGGGGTQPKENRIIIRTVADDALKLTLGGALNGLVYNPTASWHINASTTSAASLRIPGGSTPTSPNEGDVWQANNHLYSRLNNLNAQLDDNGGVATFNGNGVTLSFSIPHGLGYTPTKFTVEAGSAAAAGLQYRNADATNLYGVFSTAPVSGTGNVILNWTAK